MKRNFGLIWCATHGDRVQHVHLRGMRVCTHVHVSSVGHWLKNEKQPLKRCVKCVRRLQMALVTPPPPPEKQMNLFQPLALVTL